ncbi:MAG TPA: hypothetical protein VFN21_07485 [Acidimicrobiales bacterium]|nr:hypothetical protein [Acidimicrobiales bacterium]
MSGQPRLGGSASGGSGGGTDRLDAEIERLRAERDALAAEASKLDRRVRGGRTRRLIAALLAVLACVSMLGATLSFWANRNLLDNDVWVERTGPTIDDPAVQRAVTVALTGQIMTLVDPQELFESALPPRGQVLAVPLSSAVETFVRDRVAEFVAGDRFHQMWNTTLRNAHRAAVATLRGESTDVVDTSNGSVNINLIPAIDAVLAQIATVSPELFGHSVKIPKITVDDLPSVARDRLGDALGVDLDDDFGTVTVYDSSALRSVQDVMRIFDRLLPLTVIATALFGVAALVVSRRRRRTALQLAIGFALMLVLVRRLALRSSSDVLGLIGDPSDAAAAKVVIDAFVDPLLSTTRWVLLGLAVVVGLLVVTGPYGWVVALRRGIADLARGATSTAGSLAHGAASTAGGLARRDTTTAWIQRHATLLQGAGVAAVLAVLWFFDLSWWGLLVVVVVIGAAEFVVYRIVEQGRVDPSLG